VVTKESETLASVPTVKVDQVVIFGAVQVTTPAIVHLLLAGVDAVFLSESGRYYGRILSSDSKFGELRRAQMRLIDDPARALPVAQEFVRAKLMNQKTFLESTPLAGRPREVAAAISGLADVLAHVPRTQTAGSLMGAEGKGGALYFTAFRSLLTADLGFRARIRRPPRDPVNALLSFGYTLLSYAVQSAVQTVGLDPYLGFLHVPAYSRPSLVLDLMEEFRTAVVDADVVRMVNRRELTADDFVTSEEDPDRPVLLTDAGRRRFLAAFEARLQPKVVGDDGSAGGPRPAFRRIFEQQARQIARLALGEQSAYRPWLQGAP
jgi:CRISPR-associated protein Cas1